MSRWRIRVGVGVAAAAVGLLGTTWAADAGPLVSKCIGAVGRDYCAEVHVHDADSRFGPHVPAPWDEVFVYAVTPGAVPSDEGPSATIGCNGDGELILGGTLTPGALPNGVDQPLPIPCP